MADVPRLRLSAVGSASTNSTRRLGIGISIAAANVAQRGKDGPDGPALLILAGLRWGSAVGPAFAENDVVCLWEESEPK